MKLNIIYAIMLCAALALVSCDKDETDPAKVKYAVALTAGENGSATATVDGVPVTEAKAGTTVTLTATAHTDYAFWQWTVTAGGEALIANPNDNPVTFTMPDANVVVKAEIITDNILTLIIDPVFKAYAQERMDTPYLYEDFEKYFDENYNRGDILATHPKWDANGDGKLSPKEAAAVVSINVGRNFLKSISEGVHPPVPVLKSFSEVAYFSGLKYLSCDGHQLTTLDLSKNRKLFFLECQYSSLTTLDVSNNRELVSLECDGNTLAELDMSNSTKLLYLDCGNNGLTKLDVSNNRELQYLGCEDNSLTQLDVSNNTKLVYLECQYNDLTELDVTKNTELTRLDCYNNQLPGLDITKNTKLEHLDCEQNRMKTLDASKMAFDEDNEYTLYCGNQTTTDGTEAQTLTLTLRADMKSWWEAKLKSSEYNQNVQLQQ